MAIVSPEGLRAILSHKRDCEQCANSWKCDGDYCYGYVERNEEDNETTEEE
ncbi:MAG: hypothetical protein MJZ81_07680 [Bacteroidales bacterium]|nr:hypothetical protein [Bacteroidales bacterium]